ncbi:uncharacterized protein BYT42DRAFT_558757, partial [Radiomyces spectabilis]|uniref:uncharacterized protein n=1 Tax=Radiomyces spectabilis TaxID=64574 RepID=UPI00221E6C78
MPKASWLMPFLWAGSMLRFVLYSMHSTFLRICIFSDAVSRHCRYLYAFTWLSPILSFRLIVPFLDSSYMPPKILILKRHKLHVCKPKDVVFFQFQAHHLVQYLSEPDTKWDRRM